MNGNRIWLMLMIAGVAITLALPSAAHKAASGQDYDISCCGGHDCRQLTEADVPKELAAVEDGWLIIPTGEHFLSTDRKHVKVSTDGAFHRCSSKEGSVTGVTYCLYVPAQA